MHKAISCHNLILIMSTQCNNTLSLELAAIVQYENNRRACDKSRLGPTPPKSEFVISIAICLQSGCKEHGL